MIQTNKTKKIVAALLADSLMFANFMAIQACAAGDVSGAFTNTWDSAKSQIKTIVNNVVFPVIDVILVILLFVKVAMAYMDYRNHGHIEWAPIAVIFGGLLFALSAPNFIWGVVGV